MSRSARSELARRAMKVLCKRSLAAFVQHSHDTLEPGTELEWSWHLEAFCFHVQAMLEGWLVANGHGDEEMRKRVVATWHAHGLTFRERSLLVQNLILNLPPGTLKSRILMVCANAWMWLHHPSWSMCAISSVKDNVKRDSDACRELVQSPWYRETFEIEWTIKDGKRNKKTGKRAVKADSVEHWETTAGGLRKSRTMLGGFTGIHVDALFLDDPDDAHKVHSAAKRAEIQGKWTRSIKNRVKHLDRSIRIAIQQRVHVDDWTAAQVTKGVWTPDDRKAWAWVVIPLMYGHAPSDAPVISPWFWQDPRTVANDNMQSSRFTDETIADEVRDRGPDGFEAQYNQNPSSFDDGMIKRGYVRFFRVAGEPLTTRPRPYGCGIYDDGERAGDPIPAYVLERDPDTGALQLDWMTITIDASNGSEAITASAVGILVVGGRGQERFVFDDRTAVMGIEAMYAAVKETVNAWPVVGRVLVELKAAGPSVIAALDRMIRDGEIVDAEGNPRVVVVEAINVPAHEDKESRAMGMQPSWAQGLIYVLDGAAWLYPRVASGGRVVDEGFINEITSFPRSKRSDRVDAMSQLMAYYRERGDARSRWRTLSRLGPRR